MPAPQEGNERRSDNQPPETVQINSFMGSRKVFLITAEVYFLLNQSDEDIIETKDVAGGFVISDREGQFFIGREANGSCLLLDNSSLGYETISRRHLDVYYTFVDGVLTLTISDVSSNGAYLSRGGNVWNVKKYELKTGRRLDLREGDILQLGNVVFAVRFREVDGSMLVWLQKQNQTSLVENS